MQGITCNVYVCECFRPTTSWILDFSHLALHLLLEFPALCSVLHLFILMWLATHWLCSSSQSSLQLCLKPSWPIFVYEFRGWCIFMLIVSYDDMIKSRLEHHIKFIDFEIPLHSCVTWTQGGCMTARDVCEQAWSWPHPSCRHAVSSKQRGQVMCLRNELRALGTSHYSRALGTSYYSCALGTSYVP